MSKRKIILEHRLAPGDVTVTTGLVRDIKLTYGDLYDVDFHTNFPAIYEHNPHLTKLRKQDKGVEHHELCYKRGIQSAGRGNKHHFLTWFYKDFTKRTGIELACLHSKTDLHLSDYEKMTPPVSGRYWLVFGGGKSDMYTKHWDYGRYQQVVDRLRPHGLRFAQSGATKKNHTHPPMKDVLNLVGWGYVNHMKWQIAHCEGVIAPITCAMHMAAAFDKPCVVIAGGREEPWWEAYTDEWGAFGPKAAPVRVPHKYLHTLGQLDCCEKKGCWKKKVTKGQGDDKSVCHMPAIRPGLQTIPECMNMITVDHVVEAVMSYYEEGWLPPPGESVQTRNECIAARIDQHDKITHSTADYEILQGGATAG